MMSTNVNISTDRLTPELDSEWNEQDWYQLLSSLVDDGLVTWREACAHTLGGLNPSQVGTSLASNKNIQSRYPSRQCWKNVRKWHFQQSGACADCGSPMALQADHVVPKELVGFVGAQFQDSAPITDELKEDIRNTIIAGITNPKDYEVVTEQLLSHLANDLAEAINSGQQKFSYIADRLENLILRCRRCNVIRRPSHANGGLTFLTTESALMWILLTKKPSSYQAYEKMCREYGMTMANIRFQEAWAKARWLERKGSYIISPDSIF